MGGGDFQKGAGFSKLSGSALDAFEAAMRGSMHTDAAMVRNISERFFEKMTEHADDISNRKIFSFIIEAKIDGGEKQFELFKGAISAALWEIKITEYSLGHDGGDGFYNPRSGDASEINQGCPISRIAFFNRPETPQCPCCNGNMDVRQMEVDLFQCHSDNCALMFRVDTSFESYFGGKYPNCEICEDSEDVWWSPDGYFDHCGDCNEDYDEYGCGPFLCGECSHRINDEGGCVDPECDCEDWDDDDD